MQIVFTDPPKKHPSPKPYGTPASHPWAEIAEQLRARPGEWALCLRDVAVSPANIKRGKIAAFRPAGTFDVRTVQRHGFDERGRPLIDLYIRYNGTTNEGVNQ